MVKMGDANTAPLEKFITLCQKEEKLQIKTTSHEEIKNSK